MKKGPNRFSYNVLDTRCVKVFGVISLSSFIRYMLTRNRRCSFLHCQLWDRNTPIIAHSV
jgi:hypothetical protein